jgi:hypothetical protein
MSQAPRPCSTPSMIAPENGSPAQRAVSPGGTTSVWPAITNTGLALPKRA